MSLKNIFLKKHGKTRQAIYYYPITWKFESFVIFHRHVQMTWNFEFRGFSTRAFIWAIQIEHSRTNSILSWLKSDPKFGVPDLVERSFCSKVQNNKLFQTSFNAFGCALSNETTPNLVHLTDLTIWSYMLGPCHLNMAYGIKQKLFNDKTISIRWKDSPWSIVFTVKKSLF